LVKHLRLHANVATRLDTRWKSVFLRRNEKDRRLGHPIVASEAPGGERRLVDIEHLALVMNLDFLSKDLLQILLKCELHIGMRRAEIEVAPLRRRFAEIVSDRHRDRVAYAAVNRIGHISALAFRTSAPACVVRGRLISSCPQTMRKDF